VDTRHRDGAPGGGASRSISGRLYDELPLLVELADHAPSPRDLKPWRLRARDGGVDLFLDAAKVSSTTIDSEGPASRRQSLIACGAALFNIRVAMGHLGIEPRVALLPDPGTPDLLARLEPAEARAPESPEEELLIAMLRRHTSRGTFELGALPEPLIDRLAAAAVAEGAVLMPAAGVSGSPLDRLLAAADSGSPDDPARQLGLRAPWLDVSARATVRVVCTSNDAPADWLRAGQGLQRLLLTATTHGSQARFFTLALEDRALRERVRREVCSGRHPQVVLELGLPPEPDRCEASRHI
jgi:hypothetical protein